MMDGYWTQVSLKEMTGENAKPIFVLPRTQILIPLIFFLFSINTSKLYLPLLSGLHYVPGMVPSAGQEVISAMAQWESPFYRWGFERLNNLLQCSRVEYIYIQVC